MLLLLAGASSGAPPEPEATASAGPGWRTRVVDEPPDDSNDIVLTLLL
jgi:hypothetical protein